MLNLVRFDVRGHLHWCQASEPAPLLGRSGFATTKCFSHKINYSSSDYQFKLCVCVSVFLCGSFVSQGMRW